MSESKTEIVRVLRLLEYVGPRSFVEKCLEGRTVKGRPRIRSREGYIQEAILGETYEVINPVKQDKTVGSLPEDSD